jgi:hypothetical protein
LSAQVDPRLTRTGGRAPRFPVHGFPPRLCSQDNKSECTVLLAKQTQIIVALKVQISGEPDRGRRCRATQISSGAANLVRIEVLPAVSALENTAIDSLSGEEAFRLYKMSGEENRLDATDKVTGSSSAIEQEQEQEQELEQEYEWVDEENPLEKKNIASKNVRLEHVPLSSWIPYTNMEMNSSQTGRYSPPIDGQRHVTPDT